MADIALPVFVSIMNQESAQQLSGMSGFRWKNMCVSIYVCQDMDNIYKYIKYRLIEMTFFVKHLEFVPLDVKKNPF